MKRLLLLLLAACLLLGTVSALAQEEVTRLGQEMEALAAELQQKVQEQSAGWDPAAVELETVAIAPRKSDIYDVRVCLLWEPVLHFTTETGEQRG